MKKVTAILLGLVMVLGLTACSSGTDSETTAAQTTAAQTTEEQTTEAAAETETETTAAQTENGTETETGAGGETTEGEAESETQTGDGTAWPVDTFIEANDFTGKTVIPFCTSSSSGLGESGQLLAEMAGTGDWQEGIRFSSNVSEEDVQAWIDELGL